MATDLQKSLVREKAVSWLERPIDIASLAAFRILFGLLMAGAMLRFLAKGWVQELYSAPAFHFTYPGLDWIRPWPEPLMHAHFVLLALFAMGVAAGFFYRVCIVLFFIGFTYVELIDQTTYLNHYYLISLIAGILIFLPAHRAWSLDARRKPEIAVDAVPAWCLNILRFQIGVVYIFAGLAKFNADWLFRAEPLRIWLAARSDLPLLGPLLNETWVAYAASWFGAIFDSTIVVFLLWKRTRRPAYVLLVFFHVATWMLFNIGMFPWIMMLAATVFFSAAWPRKWISKFSAFAPKHRETKGGAEQLNAPDALIHARRRVLLSPGISLLRWPLCFYAVVQLVLPLRPYLVSQPPTWTCSGFNCAWQVMVAEKTGYTEFFAFDPATRERRKLSLKKYLTPRQEMMMAQDPYLIRQMARRLAADLNGPGRSTTQIRVNAFATLNGRPSQHLINPDVDLAATMPSDWIVTLKH
jgi:hypothetical protein